MIELRVLGSLDLTRPNGEEIHSVLVQPKRLALLAYLALATPRGLHRRDKLVAVLWPELDEAHARNSLSQALRFLRQHLGPQTIVVRGQEEVGLDPDVVWCDVVEYEKALANDDLPTALELYRGDLLVGFFLSNCLEFEEWLEAERERLKESAAGVSWASAHRLVEEGGLVEAERMAQRALALVPTDERAVKGFIEALAKGGDRAAAVRFYEKFAQKLQDELDLEPSARTQEVVQSIRLAVAGVNPQDNWGPESDARAASPSPHPWSGSEPSHTRWRLQSILAHPWRLATVGLVVLVVAALSLLTLRAGSPVSDGIGLTGRGETSDRSGIAVLPCRNISKDPDDAYLADGLHEEILLKLQKISSLLSVGQATVHWYWDHEVPPTQIARELGVAFIGECSVRRDGERIRLTFQLVDGGTGRQLWAEAYDRDLTAEDLLEIETDVAWRVAEAMRVILTPVERLEIAFRPTVDLEAYQAYLRGKLWWNRRTPEGVSKALGYFEAAVESDSTFALSYAGLAQIYALSTTPQFSVGLSRDEAYARVKAAAEKALTLDNALGEAHAALANMKLWFEWDWAAAEREYLRAIELNPNSPDAHVWYAWALAAQDRHQEAVSRARFAHELDPLSAPAWRNLGVVLRRARRPQEAVDQLEGLLSIHPGFRYGRKELVTAYLESGRYRDVLALDSADISAVSALVALGRRAEAVALAEGYREGSAKDRVRVHVALGEHESALAILVEEYAQRATWLLQLGFPDYDPLRSDPRFVEIMRGIGLIR